MPQGRLRGAVDGGVEVFRGIPYARPPIGPLRFRPPQPAGPWTGVRDATRPGPIVPQLRDEVDAVLGASDQPQSEADCLSLTVWRPAGTTGADRLPVMVWIHGGALVGGASSWEQFSGEAFARDGVVLVGVNYRLHALGFIDFGSAAGETDGANLGLRDVLLALSWVRNAIGGLGGDPGNVTVFGYSAGGALVNAVIAHPAARGLVRRAVLQSGTLVQLVDPATARTIAANALRRLGVAPGDRAALERVPVEQVLGLVEDGTLMEGADSPLSSPWLPTRDPSGLDLTGLEAVRAGRADELQLLLGWTVDEYRLRWVVDERPDVPEPLLRLTRAQAVEATELYTRHMPGASAVDVAEKIVSDQHFLAPALRIAQAHAARGGDAWLYEFRWRSPVDGGRLGSCHALEIPFVFDTPVAPRFHGPDLPPSLVTAVHGAWVAFARDGVPAVPGPPWPQYRRDGDPVMAFDVYSRVEHDLHPEIRAFWARIGDEGIGIA